VASSNWDTLGHVVSSGFAAIGFRLARIARVRELIAAITLVGISCMYTFPVNLDAGVPQDSLGVFHGAVLLHVRTERPAHHLEGEKLPGNAKPFSYGANPPFDEVLCLPRYASPSARPGPRPAVGWEHEPFG
jgi:hypothetical protein